MPGSTEGGVTESARVQGGPVVLDIGGDIGALIVYLPDSFAGSEIEIGYADSDKPFTHTGGEVTAFPAASRRGQQRADQGQCPGPAVGKPADPRR